MSFKDNLKYELSCNGMLIKELAAKTGINQGSISNYLRKESSVPAADVAVKIAKALNVSVEYLVTGEEVSNQIQKRTNTYTAEVRIIADKLQTLDEKELAFIDSIIEGYLKTRN